jgi:hypothetical protein
VKDGKIKKNEMGGSCGARGGRREVFTGCWWGKRSLGRHRRRWEDNIKMDLQEIGVECGEWVESAQDRDRWRALVSTSKETSGSITMWGIS